MLSLIFKSPDNHCSTAGTFILENAGGTPVGLHPYMR